MRRVSLTGVILAAAFALAQGGARAAPSNAPSLSNVAARRAAQSELETIAASLADDERGKLEGVYVAFDPSATELTTLAACDDDGDPVVVLSDAMLALVEVVARAKAVDDVFGTNKVQDYAVFLGKLQSEGARTLPPPPGFYEAAQSNDPRVHAREAARRRDAIDALVGHEIAHVTQGDFTCPHPTATRESGDATWTSAEARAAQSLAERVYTSSRVLAADATTTRWSIAKRADASEESYVALLTVFDHLPASAYARLHQVPGTTTAGSVRAQIVRASAAQTRAHSKPAPAAQ